ncbi:MAG: hypothetical protein HC849_25130 [Oscillatoriales cyanobacterium RU_3_3]|nr:hypothetical protein [Oscillatoriales cyanobacterium RU_3_3]
MTPLTQVRRPMGTEQNEEITIISVAKQQSHNPEIQKIVETCIDRLIEFDADLLTVKSLINLWNILKQINDFQIIEKLVMRIQPAIEIHCPEEVKYLTESELSNWFKCFTILKLLLEEYPICEKEPSVLIFVKDLSENENLEDAIKKQLDEWLNNIDPNFKPRASNTSGTRELQAYLMIAINPEKKNQVRAIATILCISPTGKQKEISVHLNPQSNERGVLCTRKKLPNIIEQFIQKSISNVLQTPENLLGCVCYDLTVELFLPVDYLCEPVDLWNIQDDFDNSVRLGCQHRLVVRSYDRAVKPGLKNEFSRSWHSAKEFLENQPDARLLQNKIQHLDRIECDRLMLLQEELKQKIGLKIICALPESEREMMKFLQAMLMSGIPIAFWTRCPELTPCEVDAGIKEFLTAQLLLNPCELLKKVKTERESAFCCETPEKHWASHLSVLWDNWERMPTLEPLKP